MSVVILDLSAQGFDLTFGLLGFDPATLGAQSGPCCNAPFGGLEGFFDQFAQADLRNLAVAGLRSGVLDEQHQRAVARPFAAREAFEAVFDGLAQMRGAGGLEPKLDGSRDFIDVLATRTLGAGEAFGQLPIFDGDLVIDADHGVMMGLLGLGCNFGLKGLGDCVFAVEHQISHDLAYFGGHAEADFEAAIGNIVAVVMRMEAQKRCAAGGFGADAGPSFKDFGAL